MYLDLVILQQKERIVKDYNIILSQLKRKIII